MPMNANATHVTSFPATRDRRATVEVCRHQEGRGYVVVTLRQADPKAKRRTPYRFVIEQDDLRTLYHVLRDAATLLGDDRLPVPFTWRKP